MPPSRSGGRRQAAGHFDAEIVKVPVAQKKARPRWQVDKDEGRAAATSSKLPGPGRRSKDGTVT